MRSLFKSGESTRRRETPAPRIAMVLPRLELNGLTRVNATLASEFAARGYSVDVLTRDPGGAMARDFESAASICPIGVGSRSRFLPNLIGYLRHSQPTHVISCSDDVNLALLAVRGILRQHFFILAVSHNSIVGSLADRCRNRPLRRWMLLQGIRRWYGKLDAVCAVSHGLTNELHRLTGLPRGNISVLPNPVLDREFLEIVTDASAGVIIADGIAGDGRSCPLVGFFGRLEEQKNVGLLLRAFALVRSKVPCRLLIVGEGVRAAQLVALAEDLGVSAFTTFHQFTRRPAELMRSCNLLVLPSRYEGFGNVLVEAMACGVQVVSTDCQYGPSEILEGGKLGQLVPIDDVKELAEAIEKSLCGNFRVEPYVLKHAAGKYTVKSSTDAYLRALNLQNSSQ